MEEVHTVMVACFSRCVQCQLIRLQLVSLDGGSGFSITSCVENENETCMRPFDRNRVAA